MIQQFPAPAARKKGSGVACAASAAPVRSPMIYVYIHTHMLVQYVYRQLYHLIS